MACYMVYSKYAHSSCNNKGNTLFSIDDTIIGNSKYCIN